MPTFLELPPKEATSTATSRKLLFIDSSVNADYTFTVALGRKGVDHEPIIQSVIEDMLLASKFKTASAALSSTRSSTRHWDVPTIKHFL